MSEYPLYRYPPRTVLGLAARLLIGGRRSFHQDGLECIRRLEPPLRVLGEENIPQSGPCLLTFNHYFRSGFNAWWMALALAAVVPLDIHFVTTGELTYPGKWYAPLGMALSHALLQRFANIYGFTTMPPMPPRPKDVTARSRSVLATLTYARAHPQAILGLAPEGGDQPGGVLNWPPPGAGRFLALLAGAGFRITPAAAFEDQGSFCLNFGESYPLEIPDGLSGNEKDHWAAKVVMQRIAKLLPIRLQGVFSREKMSRR